MNKKSELLYLLKLVIILSLSLGMFEPVRAEEELPAPGFTSIVMNTQGITLNISEVEGADLYEVEIDGHDPIEVVSLTYTDKNVLRKAGQPFTYRVRAYDIESDSYSSYSEAVTVIFNPFSGDVEEESSYSDAVAWAYNNGIVNGLSGQDDMFGPQDSVQRQHFTIMLWRYAGQPKGSTTNRFADLKKVGSSARKSILWAAGRKIIKGFKKGKKTYFKPTASITREQALIMLYRYAGSPKVSAAMKNDLYETCSDDFSSCNGASVNAMAWALDEGIFIGTPDEEGKIFINPKDECIRTELCVFLRNYFVEKTAENVGMNLATYPLDIDSPYYRLAHKIVTIAKNEPSKAENSKGVTKYGKYFGHPTAEWCTEFIIWCSIKAVEQLDDPRVKGLYPRVTDSEAAIRYYKRHNAYFKRGAIVPRIGDLIFFDTNHDGTSDHTGLITKVQYDSKKKKTYIYTIEGNIPGDNPSIYIRKRKFASTNSIILGYGTYFVSDD